MLTIRFEFPPETLELENARDVKNMSSEDLVYWCFASNVNLVDVSTSRSYLELRDAAFFQLIDGFSQIRNALRRKTQEFAVEIQDRYGHFSLLGEFANNILAFKELATKTQFTLDKENTENAFDDFIESGLHEAEALFPELKLNSNYRFLKKSWSAN